MSRESQLQAEVEDTAHEVSYTLQCTFNNRGVTAEQREAMANLIREQAQALRTFAHLISVGVSKTKLRRRSSATGVSDIDID